VTSYFPSDDELTGMSVARLSRLLHDGQVSPVELMSATFARIDQLKTPLNAFITVCREQAMLDAKTAEVELKAGRSLGPLHGIGFSVKDLTHTVGVRTTMGSPLFEDFVPDKDAVPVARLKAAGAILIGKTTTPAFGHKPLTDGILFGQTLNPYDADLTCGGSSGGAAVAIATGQGTIALGTDGGGSVRIPAACCGVVGLKATLGVIPHIHNADMFGASSYIGPMGRCVDDVAMTFKTIAGADKRDPFGQQQFALENRTDIKSLRIGWMPKVGNQHVDPNCVSAAKSAVDILDGLGAKVEQTSIDFVTLEHAFLIILQSALCAKLDNHLHNSPQKIDPSLAQTIEQGRRWSAAELQWANAERSKAFLAVQKQFEKFDVLISPTLARPPISIDQNPHQHVTINGEDAGKIRAGWYPYTYGANLTGHPAISMPTKFKSENGMPLSVQLMGPWYSENILLQLARMIESSSV
jgi:aspartyl-tRNA(Asn)/glutamyl-tRNA(Gln) amidotransferase subunit A